MKISLILLAVILSACWSTTTEAQPAPTGAERGDAQRSGVYSSPAVPAPGKELWQSDRLFAFKRTSVASGGANWDYSRGDPPFQLQSLGGENEAGYIVGQGAQVKPFTFYYLSPIVQEGVAYFTTFLGDGYLFATDLATGKLKWKISRSGEAFTSPTIVGKVLYVSVGKQLHALDLTSQRELWSFDASATISTYQPPLVVNGVVLFGSNDGNLYALDAARGKEKWTFKTGHAVKWNPLVFSGDTVIAMETTGLIHALKVSSPGELWTFQSARSARRPAISGDTFYFVDADGNINALGLGDGKPRPDFKKKNRTQEEFAIFEGKLIFGGWDTGSIFAADVSTGERIWKFDNQLPCRGPAVSGGIVYVNCSDSKLYALDAATGKKLWSKDTGQQIMSAPVIADGALYFLADDGKIHAVK